MVNRNAITDDQLIENGYKKYKPTRLHHDGIECIFQKRFDDEKGKKYYIDVEKWSAFAINNTDLIPVSYEFLSQFRFIDEPVDIKLFGGSWDLKSAEQHFEDLWEKMNYDYYELWDEC